MHGWYWNGWLGLLFMVVTTVVLLGGLVAVGVLITRQFRPSRDIDEPTSARRILDERLARGEIDAQEYQARLEILRRT